MSTTLAATLMSDPIISSSNTEIGRVTFPNAIPVTSLKFDRSNINEHSVEEVQRACDYLKTVKLNCKSTANWFYSKGSRSKAWTKDTIHNEFGRACHASLPCMDKQAYENVIAFENAWGRNSRVPSDSLNAGPDKNLSWPFLSWFLYESPYGEFILNRDDFEFCATYGFIVSGSIPHGLLQNIAIISRHFYEVKKDAFVRFNELTLEKGIDPTIAYAFLFNSYYSYYGESYLNHPFNVYPGHRVAGTYDPPTFCNLFKGVWGQAVKNKSGDHRVTTGSMGLFCTNGNSYMGFYHWSYRDKQFQDALKKYRKPDADLTAYKPPNPFIKQNNSPRILEKGRFTFQEMFDFVIPYVDELIRKELKN